MAKHSYIRLVLSSVVLLTAIATAQQTPFPLMVNIWGYAQGVASGTPVGIANWPNGEGSLTVTGTQGTNTLAIRSVNVGTIADYKIDTRYPAGWAIVVLGDDGVYRLYTVYAVDTTNRILSIFPSLASSVTSQTAGNLFDSYSSEHFTTMGYYGMADFVVSQTKGASYVKAYAARYVSDGLGNYSGTPWTAIGGLTQGGYVPPTNCMTSGVFNYTSTMDHAICNAYSGNDRSAINGSTYQTLIGAAVAGQGARLTANLNGKSGYLDTFVGIEGQYQTQQASARVQVTIDGVVVVNKNFGGLTRVQVPFTHAQSGEIDVTVDSPYPCAPRISNTNWYVWNDADWNGVSPTDPLLPGTSKILVLMDSWGTWHNNAFATRLAHDLPSATVVNVSQPGQTTQWAINNFPTLSTGGPYDYVISDFQINDLHPDLKGGLSDAQLLANLKTLWGMVLQSGATPIYLRSLPTDTLTQEQRLNQWDQSLTANYPVQMQQQQPQTITFPNPGAQTYGAAPITLTATASSGLPVSYRIVSGPATVSGSVLTITGAGSVTVEADQAGNSSWLPATPVQDSFTVNPAALTVTANNSSMTYGGAVPSFTASYSGFVNGDGQGVLSGSPSLTTNATSASPVGTYTIAAAQGTLASQNYTFSFVNGTLTVNPAVLIVAASNLSMTYGSPLPQLVYTVSGFVNGDTQSVLTGAPALSTGATQTSPPGTYAIAISQGTLQAQNYTFTFASGVLVIQQASSGVVVTSQYSTLYPWQATGLTATVTIAGSGGAPSGAVNFLLGQTLLGSATLTPTDGTDATATMNLNGSQLVAGTNNITAVYSGDTNYTGSTSAAITITLLTSTLNFNSVAVGSPAPVQTLTYVFPSDTILSAINILTAGQSSLDYTDGGSTTCSVGTPYTSGQSCTVTVGFTPSAPGLRAGAVTLFAQGSSAPQTTWYLTGIGASPAVTIDPGTQTTVASIPGALTYGSAIDGAGNIYLADNANGQVIEIASGSLTQTTVVNNLTQPTSLALDGAGNLYIAQSTGVVMVPNENGTLNQSDMATVNVAGLGMPQGVAVDSAGNVFIADGTNGNVVEVPAHGTVSTVASGLTNPHAVALDAAGNVYVTSDNQVSEYPVGGGTPVALGSGYNSPHSLAVDASGTVYVADTGNAQIVRVMAGGAAQSVLTVTGISAPVGLVVDATGNVYVSDGGSLLEVNRTQAATLNFGNEPDGGTSPAQTVTVSNIGTQNLTASNLVVSSGFLQQASGGTDCSATMQLAVGN